MKTKYIVANWKSYKTKKDTDEWIDVFSSSISQEDVRNKVVIVCPPFTLLDHLRKIVSERSLPLKIGAQNLSPFGEGSYTGEVNGRQVREFATHVLIGHSERKRFGETKEILEKKIMEAKKNSLLAILCIAKTEDILSGADMIAYEPLSAIGSGKLEDHGEIARISEEIKNSSNALVLYGGSVDPQNTASVTNLATIDGVLVGGGSLDPSVFASIVQYA